MRIYSGVVLKESLAEPEILSSLEVVEVFTKNEAEPTDEQPKTWTWYRIQASEEDVMKVAESLAHALKPRAWYTNLWIDGDYILIFPNRIFRAASIDDPIWNDAIEHGTSIGVPIAQLTPIDDILHTS